MPVFHNKSILMFFFWLLLLNTMWSPIAVLILSLAGINVPQENVQIAALSTGFICISWLMSVIKVKISFFEDNPLSVELPISIECEVINTDVALNIVNL